MVNSSTGDLRKRKWSRVMKHKGIKQLWINWFDTDNDDTVKIEQALLSEVNALVCPYPKLNK